MAREMASQKRINLLVVKYLLYVDQYTGKIITGHVAKYKLHSSRNYFMFSQTVNDVLVGVTYAALSRYYFRKTGNK
jgi:ribosomal protein L35AE/L33A